MTLREGLLFSDGHPVDADDVIFSFEVFQDPEVASPQRELLVADGQPIGVRRLDERRLEFRLSTPYAAGERLFDSVAILPRHLLEESYRQGAIDRAWGLDVAPEAIAGLGPFRLKSYVAAERLVLERNPHYWKRDEAGRSLPYLDEIVFLFVPSEDAQVLRFLGGETDVIDSLSAANFALIEAQRPAYRLEDLGPGLTFQLLFFNLNRLPAGALPAIAARQQWFRMERFRQAVSAAIDREAIVSLVYQGRATPLWSHVSAGLKLWLNERLPRPPRSVERARQLLAAAGFGWDAEGRLLGPERRRVEFSLTTNASNSERMQILTILQDDLRQLGMAVQVVPLEFRALLDRIFRSFEYEACVLGLGGGDADPNPSMTVLMSSGGSHLWQVEPRTPLTAWQEEIDRLMERQSRTLDPAERKALYDRVQELVAENLPFIPLVSPNVLVGARPGLGNFRPAVLDHHTLWNADELYWREGYRK